ncbi:MAG: hypothetical protein WDO18_01735 [Acidobacteriota bacterium]
MPKAAKFSSWLPASMPPWFAATSLHVLGLLLLLLAAVTVGPPPPRPPHILQIPLSLPNLTPPPPMEGSGESGGGHSDPDPAQRGRPPKPAARTFVLPAVARTEPSVLEIITGMADVPDLDLPYAQLGDPLSDIRKGGLGRLPGGGIGDHGGLGDGPGDKDGGRSGKGGPGNLGPRESDA